jgi:hypothetical protein
MGFPPEIMAFKVTEQIVHSENGGRNVADLRFGFLAALKMPQRWSAYQAWTTKA